MIEVSIGSRQVLKGLTVAEKSKIKKDLTFNNPAYESALRYSKYNKVYVPKYLYYYEEKGGKLSVPTGYEIPFPYNIVEDTQLELNVEYPNTNIVLRENQAKALARFKEKGTVVLPTGEGKTIFALYLAGKLKQRVLVVVNKDDLVEGWTKDAKVCYGEDFEVGLVKGKTFKIGEQITLTTIQTLSKLGEEKLKALRENISMLILDEVHRAGAKSYQVLNEFSTKFKLGLTATLMRNDGLVDVITLLCGKEVYNGTNAKSTAIIPPENILIVRRESNVVWKPMASFYYTNTYLNVDDIEIGDKILLKYSFDWWVEVRELEAKGKVKAYPLKIQDGADKIANDPVFNRDVCDDIRMEYNKGKSCVVFCRTIQQLELLYETLKDSCPKIQKFYGGMRDTKEAVLERAESKEVLITLATIAIATEGTNVKSWEVGFLVSSVANEKDLIQILGRLRRTKEGKNFVTFYDYRHPNCVAFNKHGAKRDEWYRNLNIRS